MGSCDRETATPGLGCPTGECPCEDVNATEGTESMRLVKCHLGQKSFQEISTDSVNLLHSQTQDCHLELII